MSSPAPLLPARTRQGPVDSAREVHISGEATNADAAEPVAQSEIDTDDPDHRVNPLLAVAVGMAFMFGALALLLAFG
ncbi:MAG TPA: hypothetical protein VNZ53_16160 [Steroidobacteraceae bacterium]|nr:hypothetical protein [Steroidobacteraceae bacterium]